MERSKASARAGIFPAIHAHVTIQIPVLWLTGKEDWYQLWSMSSAILARTSSENLCIPSKNLLTSQTPGEGGGLSAPWTLNPDTVYNIKDPENHGKLIPCLWFSGQIPLMFSSKCMIFRPCLKIFVKSLNLRPCLWADGQKTIPWRRHVPI